MKGLRKKGRRTWREALRALGDSVVGVFEAELAVLKEDWKRSAIRLGIAAGLGFLALVLTTYLVGVILFALVLFLGRWMSLWAAGFSVVGLMVLMIVVLGLAAYWVMRGFENPVTGFRRRLDEHLKWWQESLLRQGAEQGREDDDVE